MFEDEGGAQSAAVSAFLAERDGSNLIERKAVYRAQLEIRSMPASLVVQIALWPDKLADWAKESGIAPAVVYNMLAGVKPYHRVRTLLARRLNVPKSVLDYLVDAPRPEPLAKVPPDPPTGTEAGSALPSEPRTSSGAPPTASHALSTERRDVSEAETVSASATDPAADPRPERRAPRRRHAQGTRPGSQIAMNL